MTEFLDTSLNTSKKNLLCNHCMYDCKTYDHMKEHYKSEFHKYNLNRVTMNLNPLTHPEYLKKKEIYQKAHEANKKPTPAVETSTIEPRCEVCHKSFSSLNKFKEHMSSKSHKRAEEKLKENPVVQKEKIVEEEITTKDDVNVCLFCNKKSADLEHNFIHMIESHKMDVPFVFCIKSYNGFIELLAKKIFTYNACLSCDTQKFKNYKSLQNHMIDKSHTFINSEDLEEFLYKYYDKSKLLAIKEKELRRTKEFKILKIKLKVAKKIRKEKQEEEGWETVSEEEAEEKDKKTKKKKIQIEEEDDYEPITLPNGELLMEDGTVIGNKIYNIYYRQRVHFRKFDSLVDNSRRDRISKMKYNLNKRRNLPKPSYYSLSGSNKSEFERINTLFKARKQVNV